MCEYTLYESFHSNGTLHELWQTKIVNGESEIDGLQLKWNEEGVLICEKTLVDGILQGKTLWYNDDGSLRYDLNYKYDLLDGEQIMGTNIVYCIHGCFGVKYVDINFRNFIIKKQLQFKKQRQIKYCKILNKHNPNVLSNLIFNYL